MTKLEPTRTSSDLTATERLRSMLDERGVEHYDHYDVTEWVADDGEICHTSEINSNGASVMVLRKCTTPEQAIAATLGSSSCTNDCTNSERTGTCIPVLDSERDGMLYLNPRFVCSECGCQLTESRLGKVWQNFCPNCGRRIEVDDG